MDKFNGIIEDKFETIIKEFQGIVSFCYIILILLGMIFEGIYYSQFGINIFKFSGILDFLLVPFRRPIVLIILLGLSLFSYFYFYVVYEFLKRKYPKFHKKFYRNIPENGTHLKSRIKTIIIFFLVTTIAWAYVTSKNQKENLMSKSVDIRIEYDSNRKNLIEGKMIGKNDMNIFLLDNLNQVQIIPVSSNITRISPLD